MKLIQANHILLVIFILLTASSIAISRYAKPGCNDKCGNVTIPFPFGIGEKCSLSKWYNIDCNSSTPYLSSVNHVHVLGVDLGNQTVTVNMQKFINCSQKSVDLGSSPFLFDSHYNKFVYEGSCGIAVMMDDLGSVLTGCSTICSNDTITSVNMDQDNRCFGINCCETTIPQYLKSYNINITGIERQMGVGGTCGSAYLVDLNSYDQESRASRQSSGVGNSYVPASLRWILSERDQDHLSCSKNGWTGSTEDLGNGTMFSSWYCSNYYANYIPNIEGNPYLMDGYDGCQGRDATQ